MRPLSRRLRRSRTQRLQKGHEVAGGTDLAKAQQDLQRAQMERAEVLSMRPKTEENAQRARWLLAENHLGARVRRSFSS
jgi:hypothetical protein